MDFKTVQGFFTNLEAAKCQLIVDLITKKLKIDKYDVDARFAGTRNWVAQCVNFPSQDELVRSALNDILDGHGVEAIRSPNDSDKIIAEYINMGDTYDGTIVFDHETNTYILSSWGDWYEAWTNEQTTDEGEPTVQCGYCSHITPTFYDEKLGDYDWRETICESCGHNVSTGELPTKKRRKR